MATQTSAHYKYQLQNGAINLASDTLQGYLMASGFTFDPNADGTWADVSASELATGYGYTTGGQALTVSGVAEDDVNNKSVASINNVSWTASGGNLGPTPGMIIVDTTTVDNTIVGYEDFGGDQTSSQQISVTNITIEETA